MIRALVGMLAVTLLSTACSGPAMRRDTALPTAGARRIVSLIPSFTEDLCAMGAARQVVAVSRFTDDISCARGLPRVADFASVNVERIVALRADAVVGIPSQARAVEPLRAARIPVRLCPDDTFADIFRDLQALGAISGHRAAAQSLERQLRDETRRLQRSAHFSRRMRVFVAFGSGPIWTAGPRSYISTLLELAGARNAVARLDAAYGQYSAEAVLAADPDVILTDPSSNVVQSLDRQPWRSLRAVRLHRVLVIERPSILLRPGPNYNWGLSWLIERLRPLST